MFKKNQNKQKTNVRVVSTRPSSKATFSYYQNRDNQSDSNRARSTGKTKKANILVQHAAIVTSVLVIIFSVGFAMTIDSSPSVKVVNKQSSKTQQLSRPIEEYQSLAKEVLSESVLNKTKLTINTEDLEAKLLDKFPEVTDVAVALPIISRSPVVYLRIAEPANVLKSDNKLFLIDEKGRALEELEKNDLGLLVIDDKSGLSITTGQQVVPQEQILFIKQVVEQLKQKKVEVEQVSLAEFPNELHVKVKGQKYIVKFSLVGDARLQSGTYLATFKELSNQGTLPQQYIDVRVEERAYYK